MKLWVRILLSILLVSLATQIISSTYLINKNHYANIEREQARSLNEYDFIRASLSNNLVFSGATSETLKLLLSRYGDYYADRDILLSLYQEGKYIYHNLQTLEQKDYDRLLIVEPNTKLVQIVENEKDHYILVSGQLNNSNMILLYARRISPIYQARSNSYRLTFTLTALLIAILGFLSYLYSKWMTKPIDRLQQGAIAISRGNYDIRMPDHKDEFQALSEAFNLMAAAILNRTNDLEEHARKLQVFIDDLTHEMNTPLTSIQGYAEFLQAANTSEEQRLKAAGNIRTQAGRMKDIYTKLMTLTLTREQPPLLSEVEVPELFEDLRDTFFIQLDELKITLQTEISITYLNGDRTLLYLLLSNLIRNSLQALGLGGNLYVSAYMEKDRPVLEVTDNGCGIPEDKLGDVTKPFFRVDKSRSRKTGGAGLGLSICKSIADLHDAKLLIESNIGAGTTVKVIFPQLVP